MFLGRWVTGLRITAAWMAGATRMSWPTFLFWNALGGIAWATSIGLLAYFVGHSAEKIIHLAGLGGAVRRGRSAASRCGSCCACAGAGPRRWSRPRSRPSSRPRPRTRRARTTAGPRRARARRLVRPVLRPAYAASSPSIAAGAVADLDRDAARLALLGLGDADLEDAVVEARGHGVGVDALGQRQRAAEGAVRALDADVALALVLVLGLALARDGEDVVLDLDVDVVLAEAREVGLEDEVLVGLDEVHRRDPAARAPSPLPAVGVSKKVLNSRFISFCSEYELTNRLPADKCHVDASW